MKKRRALLCCFIGCMVLYLYGCGMPEELEHLFTEEQTGNEDAQEHISEHGTDVIQTYGLDESCYEIVEEQCVEGSTADVSLETQTVTKLCQNIRGMTQTELDAWDKMGMNDQSVQRVQSEQEGYYYYDALSEKQKLLYAELLMILTSESEDIIISETDEELIDPVFQAVLADHPEIFYVTGYTYTKHLLDDEVQRIGFTGAYTMEKADVEAYQRKIDEYVEVCLQNLPAEDEYERIRYLYEYIIAHTDYVLDAPENQNILSVFVYGQSVCQGYAKALEYLCMQAGLEATLVTGTIRESGYGHAWNLVKSNDAYYYVDATWGDASYTSGNGQAAMQLPNVNYEYLCITSDQLLETHEIRTVVEMPVCTSMKDNFYVREQAYFEVFDIKGVEALFANYIKGEVDCVTFKCSSRELYEQYYEYLITDQYIFQYMNSNSGVSYYVSEENASFSFWIP